MKCETLKLALYADNILDEQENEAIKIHLQECPLCRHKLSQISALRQELRLLPASKLPDFCIQKVRSAVSAKIEKKQSLRILSERLQTWLQFRFLPYFVGVSASLIFFSALWISLFSTNNAPKQSESSLSLGNASTSYNKNFDSILLEYAASRRTVSTESPSLNPSGALINLVNRQNLGKKEMVVIAEVLGNGVAKISEVVTPSNNQELLEKLEEALEQKPSPFLPASLDNRSENVKVVLKIRHIDVIEPKREAKKLRR
ncbi:MAG: zf-HC2 domain-containing protein [Pyrinomonadaceae bacterium]|nr:zf-HC2 domain-containing protein [Pyrinomonadaceae bacterium]MCX7640518.1 zf-HC2 domain-containing protein [Pyrinomonadaceae bacterium]MDW8303901.1 zf-HC2 domain-containing protein [Acidobacteriota bacterium]